MSIQAVAWALEQDLPARPKLVLVAIANHANHTDGYCWLKAETISREGACTPRSVFNFVGALVRNGFIRKALRRGDDGKQRATDYWIVFSREDAKWVPAAKHGPEEPEEEPIEGEGSEPEDTIDGMPPAQDSDGESYERHDSRQGAEMSPDSTGPVASTFHRKRIAEPSKPNSKESSASARVRGAALRSYKPPPPQPVGEVFDNGKSIFVYAGTEAYEAWARRKAKESGLTNWQLTTRKFVEGKGWRNGWYFPTLYPPPESGKSSKDPPSEPQLSDDDIKAFTGD